LWLLGIAFCFSAMLASAQSTVPVFGPKVSEGELIEALTQPPEIRTRGIKPSGITDTPQKPRSASLLITFDTNSAVLTSQARSTLDTMARALKNDRLSEFQFLIEGHADPRGSPQHNLQLSKERADAVSDYLVTVHGISRERLRTEGKGDRHILNSDNITAPENRRVTFVNSGKAR
jgi:OmpA-OmpF porin, OOP family